MNKNVLFGVVIGVLLILCCVFAYFAFRQGPGKGGTDIGPGNGTGINGSSIPPEAINRLKDRVLDGRMTMTGRGEDANWGIAKVANFRYEITVVADSTIKGKEKLENGRIKVEELRTFKRVQESLVASDVDITVALDTLPVKEFSQAVDSAVAVYTSLGGPGGELVVDLKNEGVKQLKKIDGKGLRDVLGVCGLRPSEEVEKMLGQVAQSQATRALGRIRAISGKSYRILYYLEGGKPVNFTVTNVDGSALDPDSEEYLILKRVNAFIDYSVIPDTNFRPGDSWVIRADDIQEVFDPFVDGNYTGKIRIVRDKDTQGGDWQLKMADNSQIRVVSDSGSTTGNLQLKQGSAVVDPKDITIKDMSVQGTARLKRLSRHHWLFTARIGGDCKFDGRMITVPKNDAK